MLIRRGLSGIVALMSDSWYQDGLRFTCTRCGHCCTGKPGYVWVTRAEIEALAAFLGTSLEDFTKRFLRRVDSRVSLIEKENNDCIFYEGGCKVYPARPTQCRTFPFWSENLRSRSTWEAARAECPGMGAGRLYSLEEIQRARRGEASASSE